MPRSLCPFINVRNVPRDTLIQNATVLTDMLFIYLLTQHIINLGTILGTV